MHGSYIKPTLKRNTGKVILHIGTNDLRSTKEPLEIASNIIDLAKTCRENGCDAIISEIQKRRRTKTCEMDAGWACCTLLFSFIVVFASKKCYILKSMGSVLLLLAVTMN